MLLLAAQTAGWVPVKEAKQVGLILATFVFPLEARGEAGVRQQQ